MKRKNKFRLIILGAFLCMAVGGMAQVRIGEIQAPAKGTVLDLSTNSPATSIGGLKLPLIVITDLSVIPSGTDGFTEVITTTLQKEALKGVLVYNKTTTGNIIQGIYYWTGSLWKQVIYQYVP